jgi:hypothetical protein
MTKAGNISADKNKVHFIITYFPVLSSKACPSKRMAHPLGSKSRIKHSSRFVGLITGKPIFNQRSLLDKKVLTVFFTASPFRQNSDYEGFCSHFSPCPLVC